MKKYFIAFLALFFILNSYSEGIRSTRKSNPNYKNLKMNIREFKRIGMSNFYTAVIEIQNTGNSTVSFWEGVNNYSLTLSISAAGIRFVNDCERTCFEKRINYPPQRLVLRKKYILAHKKYIIKTMAFLYSKERFIKTNENPVVLFKFNDANLEFREDQRYPYVISQNTINLFLE